MGTRDIVAMLAATAAAFAPAAARAYEVAPMIVELEPSGEAARGAMDVRNTGDQPIAVAVSLLDRSTSEPVDPETVSIFPFQATIGPLETQRFLSEERNVAVEGDALVLSEIFKWYGADFEPTVEAWIRERRPDLPPTDELRFRPYDWSLNAQP